MADKSFVQPSMTGFVFDDVKQQSMKVRTYVVMH